MVEEKEKTEDKEAHLVEEPPSKNNDGKLFSDEVFKDNLEFEDDIDNLPL